jgi:hypothetical protein
MSSAAAGRLRRRAFAPNRANVVLPGRSMRSTCASCSLPEGEAPAHLDAVDDHRAPIWRACHPHRRGDGVRRAAVPRARLRHEEEHGPLPLRIPRNRLTRHLRGLEY